MMMTDAERAATEVVLGVDTHTSMSTWGIAVFAIQIGKEAGYVAFQGVAALGATEQRGEGFKEASYLR